MAANVSKQITNNKKYDDKKKYLFFNFDIFNLTFKCTQFNQRNFDNLNLEDI
jgi:hypothetical protein